MSSLGRFVSPLATGVVGFPSPTATLSLGFGANSLPAIFDSLLDEHCACTGSFFSSFASTFKFASSLLPGRQATSSLLSPTSAFCTSSMMKKGWIYAGSFERKDYANPMICVTYEPTQIPLIYINAILFLGPSTMQQSFAAIQISLQSHFDHRCLSNNGEDAAGT